MDHTSHVHIRNASKGNFHKSLEEGETDFEWIVKTLAKKGYNGYYSIETLDNDDYDSLAEAVKYRHLLEKLLKETA